MLRVIFKQGKGGRYRWFSYVDSVFDAMSTIQGYASYSGALAAAKRHFGDGVELVLSSGDSDMDHPQYAGPRDWAD